jgi:hypothetical protein
MTDSWSPTNTSTHQDHVIAHVIGATVIGYFVLDEALHILLDIGFIWTIYVDGSMALLPHPVAIGELETTEAVREEIKADIDLLLKESVAADLKRLTSPPVQCLIHAVSFFSDDDRRRLILKGEEASLAIETSMDRAEILLYPL